MTNLFQAFDNQFSLIFSRFKIFQWSISLWKTSFNLSLGLLLIITMIFFWGYLEWQQHSRPSPEDSISYPTGASYSSIAEIKTNSESMIGQRTNLPPFKFIKRIGERAYLGTDNQDYIIINFASDIDLAKIEESISQSSMMADLRGTVRLKNISINLEKSQDLENEKIYIEIDSLPTQADPAGSPSVSPSNYL